MKTKAKLPGSIQRSSSCLVDGPVISPFRDENRPKAAYFKFVGRNKASLESWRRSGNVNKPTACDIFDVIAYRSLLASIVLHTLRCYNL